MIQTCIICNQSFQSEKSFHYHLSKSHKIKKEEYYPKFYPRSDLYSNDPIIFKDKEQYLNSFFNNRANLIKYIKERPKEEVQKTLINILKYRKESKHLKFAPSYIELKSANLLPTQPCFDLVGLDYNQVCLDLGLLLKYDYKQFVQIQAVSNQDLTALIDTREQLPLSLPIKTIKTALDFGDICIKSNKLDFNNLFFERKSINDLISTISQGYERLQDEITRAAEMNCYIVIICEKPLNHVMNFDFSQWVKKFTKASPSFIFSRIRELMQKNENCQFLFCNSREHMSELIIKLYKLTNSVKTIDLQLFLEKGMI